MPVAAPFSVLSRRLSRRLFFSKYTDFLVHRCGDRNAFNPSCGNADETYKKSLFRHTSARIDKRIGRSRDIYSDGLRNGILVHLFSGIAVAGCMGNGVGATDVFFEQKSARQYEKKLGIFFAIYVKRAQNAAIKKKRSFIFVFERL